jgi:hypothetical protein
MKHALALVALLLLTGSALYFAQRHARQDAVSANAIVDVAADWRHDNLLWLDTERSYAY